MMKTGLIVNGLSRKKKYLYKQLAQLDKSDVTFVIAETKNPFEAVGLSEKMASEGFTHIIAVGGDGTLHEVVNGVMKSGNKEVVIGVLPFGTANDFNKTINGHNNLRELMALVRHSSYQLLDVGRVGHQKKDGSHTETYFINIADLGIGAEVVNRINGSTKWLGSGLTFAKSIFSSLLTYKNQFMKIDAGSWRWQGKVKSLVLANGRYFGSGLCIAPEADLCDGQFSCIILGDISPWDYIKNVQKVKGGKQINHEQVFYKVCSEIDIEVDEACGIEADGEFIGQGSCTLSIVPKALRFLSGVVIEKI